MHQTSRRHAPATFIGRLRNGRHLPRTGRAVSETARDAVRPSPRSIRLPMLRTFRSIALCCALRRRAGGETANKNRIVLRSGRKTACKALTLQQHGGRGGIRTHEGAEPPAGFQDRCLKPLGHPSKPWEISSLSDARGRTFGESAALFASAPVPSSPVPS